MFSHQPCLQQRFIIIFWLKNDQMALKTLIYNFNQNSGQIPERKWIGS